MHLFVRKIPLDTIPDMYRSTRIIILEAFRAIKVLVTKALESYPSKFIAKIQFFHYKFISHSFEWYH